MRYRRLAVALLVASAGLAQAPVLVQQAANSGSNLASLTVTLGQPPTVGNVLIVCHDSTSGGASSVTGGGVSNWILCQSTLPADNSEIWAGVVDGGPDASSLITLGGSPNSACAIVSEWHGITIPLDFTGAIATGTDGSAADPAVSGTVFANANDLVVSMIGVHSGGGETIAAVVPQEPGFGEFTPPPPADSSIMAAAFVVPGAAGSVATSWVLGFAHIWASAIVVFRSPAAISTVSGTVFVDSDHDGSRDPGETGVAGASVTLDDGTTSTTATTDGNGLYQFTGVAAGHYTVAFQIAAGFSATTPLSYEIDVPGSGSVAGGDFGTFLTPTSATVSGTVFDDSNHNGIRNAGEGGVAGLPVTLDDGTTSITTTTDANGLYQFAGVPPVLYTVSVQLPNSLAASTPTSYPVDASFGGAVNGGDFGVYQLVVTAHDGHGIGFWASKNGLRLVTSYNLLPTLPGLFLVNRRGNFVAPGSNGALSSWLQNATATNMAYMLSAQFAAMSFNVAVGFVDGKSSVNTPAFGVITIQDLLQMAFACVVAHPYTPSGSAFRAEQEALKNVLDAANNNQNWVL